MKKATNRLPPKCVVDTNVPKTANLATAPTEVPADLEDCVVACIEAIEHVCTHGGLVIDGGDEIYDEYRRQLSMKGQPGVGDRFMKWVHDNRWNFPLEDRVTITKDGVSYRELPDHDGLRSFDPADKKFVAVAYAHPDRPPILEATDSKWWGWRTALQQVGLSVRFLCRDYIEQKFRAKMARQHD